MIRLNYNSNFDDDDNWEQYMGYLWACLLERFNCGTLDNIVEVAPGVRAKIGIGLSLLEFEGNLFVIEPNSIALNSIIQQYKAILPKANIIGLNCRFKDSLKYLPQNVDFVLGNHCLDDMLLGEYLDDSELEDFFGSTDKSYTQKKLFSKWRELEQNITALEKIKKNVKEDWKNFITEINPRMVILSQYRCYFYTRQNGFPLPDISALGVMQQIKEMLITNDNIVKEVLEACETFGDPRLPDNNQCEDYWIAGYTNTIRSRYNIPVSYKRNSDKVFIKCDIYKSKTPINPIYINQELFEEFFNMKFDWNTASEVIKNYFSITLNESSAENNKVIGCAYVDKQMDPSNIALDGNIGSGRAYYVDTNFNIKGEKTPLATSKFEEYNNGMFALTSAIWEAMCTNVLSKELETGAFEVLAVMDTGKSYSFCWSNGPVPCGQMIRVEKNGELDRITHIFQKNEKLSKEELIIIAKLFGKYEGEKFIERILQGTWSAGNISPNGHIIDLETVSTVKGRSPLFSYTNRYITNYFGYEFLGQQKILHSLGESSLNKDVSIDDLEQVFTDSRQKQLNSRLIDLIGFSKKDIDNKFQKEISKLTQMFEKLSRKMFPNFNNTGVCEWNCDQNYIFDFSKFFRHYPILRRSKLWTEQNALNLLVNQTAAMIEDENEKTNENIVNFLKEQGDTIATEEEFFTVLNQGIKFINQYDDLYQKILESNKNRQYFFEAKAYVINEDRRYLEYKGNIKLSIMNLYKQGEIKPELLNTLLNLIINSNMRRTVNQENQWYQTNIRIFKEGTFSTYLNDKGEHYFVFKLFRQCFNYEYDNKNLYIKINQKMVNCEAYCDDEKIIITGPKLNNKLLLMGYDSIKLYSSSKIVKLTILSENDYKYCEDADFVSLLDNINICE